MKYPEESRKHLFDVLTLMTQGYDRIEAIKSVAKNYNITSNTIYSQMTRELGITGDELDRMIATENGQLQFKEILKRKFQG